MWPFSKKQVIKETIINKEFENYNDIARKNIELMSKPLIKQDELNQQIKYRELTLREIMHEQYLYVNNKDFDNDIVITEVQVIKGAGSKPISINVLYQTHEEYDNLSFKKHFKSYSTKDFKDYINNKLKNQGSNE